MNKAVLQAIEQHALTPEAIEQVIALAERDDAREQYEMLVRERADIEKRIGRLVALVEQAGDITVLGTKLRELEERRNAIDTDLRGLRPMPRLAPEVVESRLAEWRRQLRQSTTQGRAVLQRVLRGRIACLRRRATAIRLKRRHDLTSCSVELSRRVPRLFRIGNAGAEHIGPEDTFDADYGSY